MPQLQGCVNLFSVQWSYVLYYQFPFTLLKVFENTYNIMSSTWHITFLNCYLTT